MPVGDAEVDRTIEGTKQVLIEFIEDGVVVESYWVDAGDPASAFPGDQTLDPDGNLNPYVWPEPSQELLDAIEMANALDALDGESINPPREPELGW